MSLSKIFYWLFSGALIVLIFMLGYGLKIIYQSEWKRIQEDLNVLVQNTADSLREHNFSKYDMFRIYTDKDYKQKIAFAAGLTQNQKKLNINFDDDISDKQIAENSKRIILPETETFGIMKKNDTVHKNLISKKVQDTMRKYLPAGMAIRFGDSANKNPVAPKGAGKKHDSIIVSYNIPGEKPIRLAINKKVVDTSQKYVPEGLQDINYYDSLLSEQLKKEQLAVPYTIELVRRPAKTQKLVSGLFLINYYDPVTYRIVYSIPRILIAKRMLPYSFTAFLLLSLVSAAFILYHKSYRLQLQAAQFREGLVSNVTHELKTPVASLQLIINALREKTGTEKDPREREYIDFAGRELTRMKTLIEKILSFSKLSERQFALSREVFKMADLVREAIEIMKIRTDSYGGELVFEQEADPELMGDKILLMNMVANIIDNALKYNCNKPVIHIRLSAGKRAAILMITDNGVGIPTKYQRKVFEPFFRVPSEGEYNTSGHGIGLSFVKQAIKLHNGTISLTSTPGQGSIFIISLPSL